MFVVDVYVGHGALVGDFLQGVLNGCSIVDLVQLDDEEFGPLFGQKCLGGAAVRAIRFAEYGNGVVSNDALGFGACCCCGGGHGRARTEEAA